MARSLEIGIFHEFTHKPGQSEAQSFDEGFELVDRAEEWGLDAVWLAELHFTPTRSVLAAPLTIASAIAARTSRIKIGTAVQVLPLCNPLRLAEESATVDQISHGRLIFGVGRSGFPRAYDAYGVPYGESRERFAETLAIVLKAWTQERFSHDGAFFRYDDVCVMPKPCQQPHPPVRIAANSPDSYAAIGAQGYPLFVAVRLGTLSDLGPLIAEYHAAYRAAGHSGGDRVFLRVPVYVAATKAEALAEPEASYMSLYRSLGSQLEASASRADVRPIESRAERGRHLETVTYDEALREKVVVGTPEMVTERIRQISDELGLDGILAEINFGGQIPHDNVRRSLELLCREVVPGLR